MKSCEMLESAHLMVLYPIDLDCTVLGLPHSHFWLLNDCSHLKIKHLKLKIEYYALGSRQALGEWVSAHLVHWKLVGIDTRRYVHGVFTFIFALSCAVRTGFRLSSGLTNNVSHA